MQRGCMQRNTRKEGSDVSQFRWFETRLDGKRLYHKKIVGTVGTEFKVMQELLRHSSFRSTLDVYTQAVTPAKHAAQAAVMSLVFSSHEDGATRVAG
jgi:hypothetical protein